MVYYSTEYPLRVSIRDHLFAFRRYAPGATVYWNLAVPGTPAFVRRHRFPVVILHTTFLSARWTPSHFLALAERVRFLSDTGAWIVALPQDEFIHTDLLAAFVRDAGVKSVCSVAPPSEWPLIYDGVDFSRVRFRQVLTGYLEPRTVDHVALLARTAPPRDIDIGYRAWHAEAWLGRHGMLKARVAEVVKAEAARRELRTDISTAPTDVLTGDAWLQFLLRIRFTIGVEGGASILDRTGAIRERTTRYTVNHPDASFAEVEAACFPGEDGGLRLFALSPRHLEACATRTGQILVEGAYGGVLEAERHYLPIARDLSNVGDVLERMKDSAGMHAMVERAYQEVARGKRTSYATFVEDVLGTIAAEVTAAPASLPARVAGRAMATADSVHHRAQFWRRGLEPTYTPWRLVLRIVRAWLADASRPVRFAVRRKLFGTRRAG